MIRSRVAAIVCSFALIGFAGTTASADSSGATAQSAAVPGVGSDFLAFFNFVAAAPLGSAERERLARATEAKTRAHPAEVQRADASLRKFLAALPKDAPLQRADLRESLRLKFESFPEHDVLRQILDRADPVVIYDKAHKRLITEGTLVAWHNAGDWMARTLSVPAPGDDFVATERADLKAHYASLTDKQQEAVAHVERNFPAMVAILDHADAAKRSQYVTSARPQAFDRSQFGMRLADAMSQFYDVALHQEFTSRLIGNMALLNNGMLLEPMYSAMISNMGAGNRAVNAGMATMMAVP